MESVLAASALLVEFLPSVTKLITIVLAPVYDEQSLRDTIFELQNTVARARLKRDLAETPVVPS